MSTVFYSDSKHRSFGSANDFGWNLRETHRCHDLATVRCEQVRLVNSLRTVEEDNRFIYIKADDKIHVAVLDLGFFSGVQLAAHLTVRLDFLNINAAYVAESNSLVLNRATPFEILTDAQLLNIEEWVTPLTTREAPCSFNDVLRNPSGIVRGTTTDRGRSSSSTSRGSTLSTSHAASSSASDATDLATVRTTSWQGSTSTAASAQYLPVACRRTSIYTSAITRCRPYTLVSPMRTSDSSRSTTTRSPSSSSSRKNFFLALCKK